MSPPLDNNCPHCSGLLESRSAQLPGALHAPSGDIYVLDEPRTRTMYECAHCARRWAIFADEPSWLRPLY
jgi:hypothetical protein